MPLLRLFKGFARQPRLALVTKTMVKSVSDLVHFGLVFFSVFGTFAIGALSAFGRDMPEFSTWFHSLTSCWRLVMGDFDYDQMMDGPGSGS